MVALILNPSGSAEEAINPLTIVVLPAPEGEDKTIITPSFSEGFTRIHTTERSVFVL